MTSSTLSKVTVLAGGISHERDVSLRSGRRVVDSLTANGIEVELRDPDATLLAHLTSSRPDVVWPALHGASGEDGALRGLLEALDIPFVGSTSAAARLAWDKPTAKELARRAGVRTPRGITLSHDAFRELGAAGVPVVDEVAGLPRAMVDAYTYCDDVIVEQKITGTEVAVGVIDTGDGPVALPAVEIVPRSGTYGFEARYNAGETTFYTPARLGAEEATAAARAAVTVHEALGLRHLSRVDLIVDAAGTPWFLEVNVLPGLTETSLVPMALDAAGYELGLVYAALAEKAVTDHR